MKHIIYTVLFFISALSYAQSTGTIKGNLLDSESNNEPLMFAKVIIKETGAQVLSNEKGFFKFENLSVGEYTLVSSFTGYKTKEIKIKVRPDYAEIYNISLSASTVSLDDLVMTFTSASIDKP